MDEAEIADRVGIMSHGTLECMGSPLFLKSLYGVGYTFTVCLDLDSITESSSSLRSVHNLIRSFFAEKAPSAALLSSTDGQISYRIPFSSAALLPTLLSSLEQQQTHLQVASFGISATTLEDVFLKVASDGSAASSTDEQPHHHDDRDSNISREHVVVEGIDASPDSAGRLWPKSVSNRFLRDLKALLKKRWNVAKRDRKVWLWQLLLPVLVSVRTQHGTPHDHYRCC